MVLVDGLAGNITAFLARLFSKLARTVTYIGGGAGSLTLQQKPCLFTPEGLFQDAALVEAAGRAAADCLPARGKNITHCLVADCISRVLFLENKFSNELKTVKRQLMTIDQALVPVGVLTLGEISSYGEGYLEFFNKTIVVGVFYEG